MKTRLLIVGISLLFGQIVYGQDNEEDADWVYKISPKDYFFNIPYSDVNGKLIINAVINDKNFRFIFDTGAEISLIRKSVAEELNLPVIGWNVAEDGTGKKDTVNTVSIPSLKIGDITFTTVAAPTLEENIIMDCFEVDGIIGFNLFVSSALRISSVDKTITITNNPEKLNHKEENSSQLFYCGGMPCILARFINQEKNIHSDNHITLDIGSNGFLSVPSSEYKERYKDTELFDFIEEYEGVMDLGLYGEFGEKNMRYHVKIHELSVNQMTFSDIDIHTGDEQMYSFGSELLDYGIIIIDNVNGKFNFEPVGESNISLKPKEKSIEVTINEDKMIIISDVMDENLKSKINTGDRVLRIDGVDYQSVSTCDILKGFLMRGKKSAVFEIEDLSTKEIKKIEIQLNK